MTYTRSMHSEQKNENNTVRSIRGVIRNRAL